MKWMSLICLLVISSCSQTPKKEKKQEVRISPRAIEVCQDYQKNIIDQSYTIQKDNSVQFTRDINLARAVLSQFDIEKSLAKQRATMVQNILSECNQDKIQIFNSEFKRVGSCSIMFSELNFFQGLAVAIKKYPWPTDLQLEAKGIALDYVRYYSEDHYPLLNRLIALSVLDGLSVNHIVNKDLHNQIKALILESQNYVQGLQMKINKDPTLTCNSLQIVRDEFSYSDELGNKMKDLLNRL